MKAVSRNLAHTTMKEQITKVELPAVWTTVVLAYFKAVPWAELAACAAFIYTLIRIAQAMGWIRTRKGSDG